MNLYKEEFIGSIKLTKIVSQLSKQILSLLVFIMNINALLFLLDNARNAFRVGEVFQQIAVCCLNFVNFIFPPDYSYWIIIM